MFGRNLRNLLLIGMTLCLLLSFLVLSLANYSASREWAREEIIQTALPLTRDTIYSEIHSDLSKPFHVAMTMAHDSFLKEWAQTGEQSQERITRYLQEIHGKYGYFSVFFVSARTSNYYHYKGLHKKIRPDDDHDVWYYRFVQSGLEYRLEVDTDEAGQNALSVFINIRVEDAQGRLLGVTGVGMKMTTLTRLLERTGNRFGRHIYLTDSQGQIQVHSDLKLISRMTLAEATGQPDLARDILKNKAQITTRHYDSPGGKVYITSRFIEEFRWHLIVEQEETAALSSARANALRIIGAGAFIWCALVGLILWAARRIHRRLREVAHTDPLTGLPNRRSFDAFFASAQARFERQNESFCLILLDADRFKAVNDQLGHHAGDALLKEMAEAMARIIRPSDHIARWGGDEFMVLAYCNESDAEALGKRLCTAVSKAACKLASPDTHDPRRHVGASFGLVSYDGTTDQDRLTSLADERMYRHKKRQRSQ